jgi:hypothetical protein
MNKVAHEQILTHTSCGAHRNACLYEWSERDTERQRETERDRERQRETEREKSLFQTAMRRAG